MQISDEELHAKGFTRGGTVVYIDAPRLFRVDIDTDVQGYAVYIMRVNGEYMKGGQTGNGRMRFKHRMSNSFNCLRKVIAGGEPYVGDPWKRYAPFTILAKQEVELWVKRHATKDGMAADEDALNRFYKGKWTKEGS